MPKIAPSCICCGLGAPSNWIDLGKTVVNEGEIDISEGDVVTPDMIPHLFQCGGMEAHAEPGTHLKGCMRVIRATPEEMSKGGMI